MGRQLLILANDEIRAKAIDWIRKSPDKTRVTFRGPARTNDQNSLMWVLLSDISRALPWHGVKLSADDWKLLFLASLNTEMRVAPNLDGNGFVDLGRSSSKLSKEEFSQLIELIYSFGAQHGVPFSERRYDG